MFWILLHKIKYVYLQPGKMPKARLLTSINFNTDMDK